MMTAGQEIAKLKAELREAREEIAEYERQLADGGCGAEDRVDIYDKVSAVCRWFGLTKNTAWVLLNLVDRAPGVVTNERLMDGRPTQHAKEATERGNVGVMIHRIRAAMLRQGLGRVIQNAHGLGHYVSGEDASRIKEHIEQAMAARP